MDRLTTVFTMQEAFMRRLASSNDSFPKEWPLDMSLKASQVEVRDIIYHSMGELFEIVQELKNSKKHRTTEIKELDRSKLVYESVDAFKLLLEALILIGVTPDEFFEAYVIKDKLINERIDQKY